MKSLFKRIILRFFIKRWQSYRISLFHALSNNSYKGEPIVNLPLQIMGKGSIEFGANNIIGINPSPFFYTGSVYIESRNVDAKIIIGDNVFINNNFVMVCDRSKIQIGKNTLIGAGVEIYDSDFHEMNPQARHSGNHICQDIVIGENVFIASNVKILKGVTIGNNSVIGNSSLVVSDIPENTVYAGVPAKFIKKL